MYHILICDDERDIVNALKIYLHDENYILHEAYNGKEALELIERQEMQLVLMDIMMPEMDGIEAMIKIREKSNVPVILLTAKSEDADKVLGLTVGADDYITKPFLPEELILRVKAVLKRTYHMEETMKNEQIGAAQVDWNAGVIRNGAEEYALTAKEYTLLRKLSENRGRILSMNVLCDTLWPDGSYGYENSLMVHIRRLREKIEENPSKPEHILTVRGLGYKLI